MGRAQRHGWHCMVGAKPKLKKTSIYVECVEYTCKIWALSWEHFIIQFILLLSIQSCFFSIRSLEIPSRKNCHLLDTAWSDKWFVLAIVSHSLHKYHMYLGGAKLSSFSFSKSKKAIDTASYADLICSIQLNESLKRNRFASNISQTLS